jgi:CP family cyanate transporter-like MFS transporter
LTDDALFTAESADVTDDALFTAESADVTDDALFTAESADVTDDALLAAESADITDDAPSLLWYAAIVLVALNLRPVISSVPPIVDRLAAGAGLSSVAAGALTTLPVICMGLFAPVAAVLARRYGSSGVLAASVGLIAVGAGLRSFGGVFGLYTGTGLAGVGIAVAGTLLPAQVRARVPDRVGPVTGTYTAALIGGALLASGLTDPLRIALGWSAQAVLGLWCVPAVVALVVWLVNARSPAAGVPATPAATLPATARPATARPAIAARSGMPWRDRRAWLGTLFMGGQSLMFYATLAWLAARYTQLGLTESQAGLLLALFSAAQIVTALAAPVLAHRAGDLRPWIAVSVGASTVALALVAVIPRQPFGPATPWLWATLLGLGMGGTLSLALTVLTNAALSPQDASAHTAMAFFVGYSLAAIGPVAAGYVRDATGSFAPVYLSLSVLGVLTLLVGVASARPVPARSWASPGVIGPVIGPSADQDLQGSGGRS